MGKAERERQSRQHIYDSPHVIVLGDWDELLDQGLFPKPLPADEAGPSKVSYGHGSEQEPPQRRYLWTDAFGILNLVTMAWRCEESEGEGGGGENRKAKLLEVSKEGRKEASNIGRPSFFLPFPSLSFPCPLSLYIYHD